MQINQMLDEAAEMIPNLHVYASLGVVRYLSLMKYSLFVMGNSSSGLYETPAFHIPTINIGDRQRGRLKAESVIDCASDEKSILHAIDQALSPSFRQVCENTTSPYGDGHAARKIAAKIVETVKQGNIDLKKKFYDIPFTVTENE